MTELEALREYASFSGTPIDMRAVLLSSADRIEKLETALRTVKEWHGYGLPPETVRMIDAALERKDD
jgi:hypothetical protein